MDEIKKEDDILLDTEPVAPESEEETEEEELVDPLEEINT